MPRSDWYFARIFLSYLGLCFAALFSLIVVADLLQRADEFFAYARKSDVGAGALTYLVIQYYMARAPSMIIQHMLPLLILLAGVITVTAVSTANEYTVLRSSGVSIQRALLPLLATALVIGYMIQVTRDWYLPYLLRKSHEIANMVHPRSARPIGLVRRDKKEIQSLSMGHFDTHGFAHNLRIEKRSLKAFYNNDESFEVYTARQAALQPRAMLDADPGDKRKSVWKPGAMAEHRYFGRWQLPPKEAWEDPLPTWVTPAILERQILGESVMTWEDLQLIAEEELSAQLEMNRRQAEPWAALILLVTGLAIVLRGCLKGNMVSYAHNIIVSIFLCAAYYVLRSGIFSMGEVEDLPAMLAAWLPTMIMGIPGVWLYLNMES